MSPQFNENFWDEYFKVYDYLNILEPYRDLIKHIIHELDLQSTDIVLDVGSGTGNIALHVKHKVQTLVCLDNSRSGIKAHLGKDKDAVVVLCDVTERLPFADNYFSKLYTNNTLYLINPETRPFVFKEFFRILKHGGKVVVSNIAEGFKPFRIYLDHVQTSCKKRGMIYTLLQIFSYLKPTVKIFYFNYLIKKNNLLGNYKFMGPDEQKLLLRQAGFVNVSNNLKVYSRQAILNSGYKPALC